MNRVPKALTILLFANAAAAAQQFGFASFDEIRNSSGWKPATPAARAVVPVQYRIVSDPSARDVRSPVSREQRRRLASALGSVEAAAGQRSMTRGQFMRVMMGLDSIGAKFVDPIPPRRWDAMIDDMVEVARKECKPGADWDPVIDHMLQAAVRDLKEPHSMYLDDKQSQAHMGYRTGSWSGIGVGASADPKGMKLRVVYPDSGAQRAGLLDGDVIVEVDGRGVGGMELDGIIGLVRGEAGTSVTVKILRAGRELGPITVERRKTAAPNAFSKMAAPGVGYVYFTRFQPDTAERVLGMIDDLRADGARSVILDVRGNPGGSVQTVAAIASEFLKDQDDIVSFKHQETLGFRAVTKGDGKYAGVPVAVLVDSGSASASEILSGALQDKRGGLTVIGSRTYGKGSEQIGLPQPGGRLLLITENRWYTPGGRSIDARHDPETGREIPGTGGIVPDVVVDVPAEQAAKVMEQILSDLLGKAPAGPRAADPALEKAIEVLEK